MRLANGKITVLPGIELRDHHGGKPIHYIGLFPEDCDLDHVWDRLKGTLSLTPAGIKEKGGHDRVYIPIEQGAPLIRDELAGLVSIHAGTKTNSIEEIRNAEQFQQRIKYDITKAFVDLMEIGQLKDVAVHHETIFPAVNLERPLIIGSDNHNARAYETAPPCWIKADPTFRGLRMAIREPRLRFFLGDRPAQLARIEHNKTKYIRAVSFTKKPGLPAGEEWLGMKSFTQSETNRSSE
jgi:hypothetical protein